ncbi:MAG TPA: hypothetical protein PKA10_08375 [Selenomonadales bacterium]|nr:hypothetical protein [Selenomonadales bacterium]
MMRVLLIVLYIVNVVYVLAEIRRQDQEACQYELEQKSGIATIQDQGEAQLPAAPPLAAAAADSDPDNDANAIMVSHIRGLLSQPD